MQAIVEHKDATEAQRRLPRSTAASWPCRHALLKRWLARLDNQNAQGEYYLTDIVKFAVADGVPVVAHRSTDALQVAGVNSPVQLAELERAFQLRQAARADGAGRAPGRPGALRCARRAAAAAQDVEIDVNCVFEGPVTLGDGVRSARTA